MGILPLWHRDILTFKYPAKELLSTIERFYSKKQTSTAHKFCATYQNYFKISDFTNFDVLFLNIIFVDVGLK